MREFIVHYPLFDVYANMPLYLSLTIYCTLRVQNQFIAVLGVAIFFKANIMEAGYGHYRVIALSRYRLVHNAITRQRDNATTR